MRSGLQVWGRLLKSGPSGLAPAVWRRLNGTAPGASTKQENWAKFLVSLKDTERLVPQTQQEADAEGQEWINAIRNFRQHVDKQGGYDRDRLFAPSDAADYRFYAEPLDKESFVPTAEQIAQYERTANLPIPPKRDDTLDYLVKLTMRHGRKERTQKYVSRALHLVYLKIRRDPIPVVKEVLDKMAPIARMKRWSDGGARAELVPVPLTERQRFRTAWNWILEASRKRPSKDFAVRLSEEIMSAINGKSPGYDKKATIHKTAVVNRSYISLLNKGSR